MSVGHIAYAPEKAATAIRPYIGWYFAYDGEMGYLFYDEKQEYEYPIG